MSAVESLARQRPLAEPVPLERSQVPRDTVALARHLLGKVLVRRFGTRSVMGRIVETEAYLQDDPACHAFRGMTARNRSLFLDVGHAYVYLCYGTSWMLNVSSEAAGTGAGILLRALEPLSGIERMRRGRESVRIADVARGPGRLCASIAGTTASTCSAAASSGSAATAARPGGSEKACASASPRVPMRASAITSPGAAT
jgi:DNA-3-methyladenine glycosylase